MPGLRRHCPPTGRLSRIRSFTGCSRQANHPHLIGRLGVPCQRRQAQQAHTFFAGAEALATEGQDMAVEAMSTDITQVCHARELTFEPVPATGLSHEPRPMKQPARQPVTGARFDPPEHSGLRRFGILVFENPHYFGRMPGSCSNTIGRTGETSETLDTLEEAGTRQTACTFAD